MFAYRLRAIWSGWLSVLPGLLVLGVWLLASPPADSFPQYSVDRDSGNCAECHGNFRVSPYISNVDGSSWGDDLHDVHRGTMLAGDCSTCHSSGSRFPVILDSSIGGAGLQPIACVGCHGRNEDMIGNPDFSPGRGAGLRQHHTEAGVLDEFGDPVCAACHSDADPGLFTPVGEDVLPPYYFLPDPNHPNKPTDPCNLAGEEDYAGNLDGLDNDGDGLWDGADPDCLAVGVCGDGFLDVAEDCDDGNTMDGDCCDSQCFFEPVDSPCPDGLFCNGDETCDGSGVCQDDLPVDCSDGVSCTDDSCDETTGCLSTPNDNNCASDEVCDPFQGCVPAPACGDGIVNQRIEECDDGNTLDGDCCSSTCTVDPPGTSCSDGVFCNGDETCDFSANCQPGADPCPGQFCNEAADICQGVTPGEDSGRGLPPLLVTAHNPATGTMTVSFGNACLTTAHNLKFGPIGGPLTYTGEVCGVGPSAGFNWNYAGTPGILDTFFFLIVGEDGTVEGSYGLYKVGTIRAERVPDPEPGGVPGTTCPRPQGLLAHRCD